MKLIQCKDKDKDKDKDFLTASLLKKKWKTKITLKIDQKLSILSTM